MKKNNPNKKSTRSLIECKPRIEKPTDFDLTANLPQIIKWHSKDKRNHWATPPDFYKAMNEVFNFTLDVAASKEWHLCQRYFTKIDNALKQSWKVGKNQSVFCNPPYVPAQSLDGWVEKSRQESENGHQTICLLIGAKTETKYFQLALKYCSHVLFIKKRLSFLGAKESSSARFGSALIIFNGNNFDLEPLNKLGFLVSVNTNTETELKAA